MMREIKFSDLPNSDLIIDALYKGGTSGNSGDDPISKLIDVGNQGGFRHSGSITNDVSKLNYVVLYSSLNDPDWPDDLDVTTGLFTFFGDNKAPGHELHNTIKKGNIILKNVFAALHRGDRGSIPPFFIFTKAGAGRDVVFKGVAVPGGYGITQTEDLVAIWKTKESQRFQNYKAIFTILDIPTVSRAWLADLKNGDPLSDNSPDAWRKWVETGVPIPLRSGKSVEYRSREEQLPTSSKGEAIIEKIYNHFKEKPTDFEKCASEIFRMMDSNVISYDLTRSWVDGGRDATGKYRVGHTNDSIEVDFALEAKCRKLSSGNGVRDTARLISRLKFRQFGVFVTTSYVSRQAYREIKEDRHPVVIISAADIVKILEEKGLYTLDEVSGWLKGNFPQS